MVGQSYLSLYPNDIHVTKNAYMQVPIADVFQAGMCTINFHTMYHRDQRDRNEVTHCSFSPPEHWRQLEHPSIKCGFGLGSVIVDLSCHNTRISFLPEQVKHCTTEPWDTPLVPKPLMTEYGSKAILNMKREFYNFAEKSMLAWGNWGWFRRNAHRQREWEQCTQGNPEPAVLRRRRRDLRDYWDNIGYDRNAELKRQRRERSRRLRRLAQARRAQLRNNSGNER